MKSFLVRLMLPMVVAMMSSHAAQASNADHPLVFITSFAPGNDGGIQAFQLDLPTGRLTPSQRTTGVENPFFLAVSSDHRFLYSIQARQFGGTENEQVAAYELVGRSGELKFLNRQSSHGTA